MGIVFVLLKQIIVMFILMLIGVLLFKYKKISLQGSKELGSLLLYVVIPVVIIKSFCLEPTNLRIQGLLWSSFLSFLSLLVAIIVSYLLFKRTYALDNFAAAFSNAGFIGIPLVQATIGGDAVFYIAPYIALLNILQWTYGVFVITQDKKVITYKKLFTNPIVIATIIGCLIFFLHVPIPDIGITIFTTISGLNTPIAMLISGVYLAQISFYSMFNNRKLFISSIVRLLMIPCITLGIFYLFSFVSMDIKLAVLIATSAPVGSNIAIFASLYDKDYLYSVKTICLSTILSVITMPCIMMMAQYLL